MPLCAPAAAPGAHFCAGDEVPGPAVDGTAGAALVAAAAAAAASAATAAVGTGSCGTTFTSSGIAAASSEPVAGVRFDDHTSAEMA
jgi:hypothetical protein